MNRMTCLVLTAILCILLMVPATADGWIYPESYNHTLQQSYETDGDCYVLNAYISRYLQCGLTSFSCDSIWANNEPETPDQEILQYTWKSLELDPTENTISFVGTDGNRYMKIPEEEFATRMHSMFGHDASTMSYNGEHNGSLVLQAENFDAQPRMYAVVNVCACADTLMTGKPEDFFSVDFSVYSTNGNVESRYGVCADNIDQFGDPKVGRGTMNFVYTGEDDDTVFSDEDFVLKSFQIAEPDYLPSYYDNANVPYTGDLSILEPPSVRDAATTSPVANDHSASPVTTTAYATNRQDSSHTIYLILIILCVILFSAAATAVVIILIRQNISSS